MSWKKKRDKENLIFNEASSMHALSSLQKFKEGVEMTLPLVFQEKL